MALDLYLHASPNIGIGLTGILDAHLLPVVCKFFSAIEANHVGAGLGSWGGAALSPFGSEGEALAFVPAPEQSVDNSHLLLRIPFAGNVPAGIGTCPRVKPAARG